MSVKDNVLKILEENKGKHFSGEDIAKTLNVSRNAVWKAVKALSDEGYMIKGVNNKGYCMSKSTDVLSEETIRHYLNKEVGEKTSIDVFKSIDSTNTRLKRLASEGASEWKILVAEEQTAGKGRLNRTFYSPVASGIYMSILLRPEVVASEALFITTMAAVAVSEAIEKTVNADTQIKWVNDIYCNGRKACGILTEASLNLENGKLDYAVLGIGINVKKPKNDFPEEIKDIATGIVEDNLIIDDLRCQITANVINNIYKYYQALETHSFMNKYREKSMLIGKNVYIRGDESREPLFVKNIDENAALVVVKKTGEEIRLSSGEVSVRPIE